MLLLYVEIVKHYKTIKIPSTKPCDADGDDDDDNGQEHMLVVLMYKYGFSCNLRIDSIELNGCGGSLRIVYIGLNMATFPGKTFPLNCFPLLFTSFIMSFWFWFDSINAR